MAALVEEEDGLLAARDRLAQRFRQGGREELRISAAAQGGLAIDDLDRRQRAAVDALREPQDAQLAFLRPAQRLQRGRRAAQHGDRRRVARPD